MNLIISNPNKRLKANAYLVREIERKIARIAELEKQVENKKPRDENSPRSDDNFSFSKKIADKLEASMNCGSCT